MNLKKIAISTGTAALLLGGIGGYVSADKDEANRVNLKTEAKQTKYMDNTKAKEKMSKEFKNKIKLPNKLPFESKKVISNLDTTEKGTEVYEEIHYFDENGIFNLRAISPAPKVLVPDEGEVEEYFEFESKFGTQLAYQDNGNMQMVKWLDESTDTYYWVIGSKDMKNEYKKYSKEELLEVVNKMLPKTK
jgi:hypothetical protein